MRYPANGIINDTLGGQIGIPEQNVITTVNKTLESSEGREEERGCTIVVADVPLGERFLTCFFLPLPGLYFVVSRLLSCGDDALRLAKDSFKAD